MSIVYVFNHAFSGSFSPNKSFPLRVPSVRAELENTPQKQEDPPTRDQYLEGLCRLRNLSLEQKLPSAFVIALSILRVKKVLNKLTVILPFSHIILC